MLDYAQRGLFMEQSREYLKFIESLGSEVVLVRLILPRGSKLILRVLSLEMSCYLVQVCALDEELLGATASLEQVVSCELKTLILDLCPCWRVRCWRH